MPGRSFIESLGIYLPSAIVSTQEVLAGCRNLTRHARRPERVQRVTGIRNRHVAADDEGAIELAKAAMVNCLRMSRYQPCDIDLLIFCGISRSTRPPRYLLEPSIAVVLSGLFECNGAVAFDVSNGCAGMFTAVQIVDALIRAGAIRVGMVVSSERISDLTRAAQHEIRGYADPRFACLTLGDAGAALILAEAPANDVGFHAIDLYTVGCYSDYCIVRPSYKPHGGPVMWTRSAELFEASTALCVPDAWEALQRCGWRDGPDQFIMHQVAQRAIDIAWHGVNRLAGREVFRADNVVNNLADRGNTASTSHFVAVWDSVVNGRIASGDRTLFSVQGSGLTAGTALYTFDDLPDRIRAARRSADRPRPTPSAGAPIAPRRRGVRSRVRSVATIRPTGRSSSSFELAHAALELCLDRASYPRNDLGLIIHTGVFRDEIIVEPATAAVIAGRAKINAAGAWPRGRKTLAFDIWNGAIGFLNGCHVADGMIRVGQCETAVVTASEIDNNAGIPGTEPAPIAAGASAVLLEASDDGTTGFGDFRFEDFPEYRNAVVSEAVLSAVPYVEFKRDQDLEALFLKCIPRTVHALLEAARLTVRDVAAVLAPALSSAFTSALADTLNIERSKFVDAGVPDGDLSSSTFPYTFARAVDSGMVRAGDIGLIINVGSGLQVGAATYYF